jgi:hypothetical protein
MWKSMIYKEWLKIRWFLAGSVIIGLVAMAYIFMNAQRAITFQGASSLWYLILFQNLQFYSLFKFIPLLIGAAIGVAQYFPETVNKRIKLTFHLPLQENKAVIMMLAAGTVSLIVCFLLHFLTFWALSSNFFGPEITHAALITIFPWFLAGLNAYFLVGLIILEPIWLYRLLYSLAALAFIPFFMKYGIAGAYAPINPILAVLTVLLSVSLLFSAYRFRKGEM